MDAGREAIADFLCSMCKDQPCKCDKRGQGRCRWVQVTLLLALKYPDGQPILVMWQQKEKP